MSSCSLVKRIQSNRTKQEIHHYHDSTHVIEKLTTKEITTLGDSTTANFLLQKLIESGYGKQVDGNFTTEVKISDGVLSVTTTLDSLVQRITELERTKTQTQSDKIVFVESKQKNKTVEVKNYTMLIVSLFLLLILVILGVSALIYFKVLKPRIL